MQKQDGQLKTAKFAKDAEPVVLFAPSANFAVLFFGPTFSQSLMAAIIDTSNFNPRAIEW